jgi:hypothetical protein
MALKPAQVVHSLNVRCVWKVRLGLLLPLMVGSYTQLLCTRICRTARTHAVHCAIRASREHSPLPHPLQVIERGGPSPEWHITRRSLRRWWFVKSLTQPRSPAACRMIQTAMSSGTRRVTISTTRLSVGRRVSCTPGLGRFESTRFDEVNASI